MLRTKTFRNSKTALFGHSLSLGLASHGEGFFIGSAMNEKKCKGCGEVKPISEYHKRPYGKPGGRSQCKECTSSWAKNHRESHINEYINRDREFRANNIERVRAEAAGRYRKNKDKRLAKSKEMARKKPLEHKARMIFAARVRGGHIVPPETCENCGEEKKLHGHHEDYSKPLEVRWLCVSCHMRHHRSRDCQEGS